MTQQSTEAEEAAVIQVEGLHASYGKGRKRVDALRGIDFEVRRGECVGFIGANGAGKSTTLKILMGFRFPSEGSAMVFAAPAGSTASRMRIGYLPEVTLYYPFMKARELLELYGGLGGLSKAELKDRIPPLLERVGLAGRSEQLLRTFSKGMQQRVGIAQSLITEPDLLIFDELSSGLDPLGRHDLRNILQDLKAQGRTIFFSSHELGEVESLCDRIVLIHKGTIVRDCSLGELREECGDRSLESFFIQTVQAEGVDMVVRQVMLVARGVCLEAVRRRDVYVVILLGCVMIGLLAKIEFFGIETLHKFFRETSLRLMGMASAFTVIILASRQLPREFENRTIYPLLARPVHRVVFVLGKLLGVLGAGAFCLGLFLTIYILGSLLVGAPVFPLLLLQFTLLQLMLLFVLASLCFVLSICFNLDAAITLGILFYVASSSLSTLAQFLYDTAGQLGQGAIQLFTWLLPQFMLFDLSEKTVHGELWDPLSLSTMLQLILYGLMYVGAYFSVTVLLFRRRAL